MTDFLLQKASGRGDVYHRSPGIWYSKSLRRWMVTSPVLIREAMYDDAFVVPSYDVSSVTKRFGVDLNYLDEIRQWFPLAVEGIQHATLRELFARHIAHRSTPAVEILSKELALKAKQLLQMETGQEFCIYSQFIEPALAKSVCCLAGVEISEDIPVTSIPQLFDDSISFARRREINATIGRILEAMPSDFTQEQKYLSTAVIALSANTLLGSVGLTFLHIAKASGTKPMSEMHWDMELQRTGLPLIEKKLIRDTVLGPVHLKQGERVRLFIEADGVLPDGVYRHSDLFFAAGAHKCVGLNFSKQVWREFARQFKSIPRSIEVLRAEERTGDYVFNLPTTIRVRFEN